MKKHIEFRLNGREEELQTSYRVGYLNGLDRAHEHLHRTLLEIKAVYLQEKKFDQLPVLEEIIRHMRRDAK